LSTFHTEETIGGLIRLLKMDIAPFLVSWTVVSVLAQRLLRRVCPICAVDTKPTPVQLQRLRSNLNDLAGAMMKVAGPLGDVRASIDAGRALAEALYERTGHAFRDTQRLQRALTHASARSAHAGIDYERFEFLGDRVLGLIVADMLLAAYPNAVEGELSLRLNALVNAEALSEIAEEIGLPELIRAGSDVRNLAERKRVNLRADALESLIAALYLDGGLEVARSFNYS